MSSCCSMLVGLSCLLGAPAPGAEQWIVVTAPAFRDAIAPLVEHRKAQGLRVLVVQTTDLLSEEEVRRGDGRRLRDHLRRLCQAHRGTSMILLVGAVAGGADDAAKTVVPACGGESGRMKGEPTDHGYGCPSADGVPAVAVGRFPARTSAEAQALVAKTLRYESDDAPGLWRRRLTVLAGIPAYNPVVDRIVEGLAMARFHRLDPAWSGHALYSNPESRFGVPENELHKQALAYVEGGQAFLFYLGHSSARGLYGGRARFLDREDWARLRIAEGPGVFFTFGCNGCQLAGPEGEGYGITAMRNPQGPAAVIGSHGICFAAMVQLGAGGLFERCFTSSLPQRLGEAWLAIKQGIAEGKIDELSYRLLDSVDGDPHVPQAAQRQEHLEMFVLLGDPALRLPQVSGDVDLQASGAVAPGGTLSIHGRLPQRLQGAAVHVSLERPVASVPSNLEPVPVAAGRERALRANHQRANCFVLAAAQGQVHEGSFQAQLRCPDPLPWPRITVRAYAAIGKAEGMAVRTLAVQPVSRP